MNFKDYAGYYIGCRCFNTWFPEGHEMYDRNWQLKAIDTYSDNPYGLNCYAEFTWTDSIKPILHRREDLPEKEGVEMFGADRYWDIICLEGMWDSFSTREFHSLIKLGYDLFGLIDAELAIDSKTISNHAIENNQDNEPPMCHWCNGTGENTSGTGSCRDCKGTGVQVKNRL